MEIYVCMWNSGEYYEAFDRLICASLDKKQAYISARAHLREESEYYPKSKVDIQVWTDGKLSSTLLTLHASRGA